MTDKARLTTSFAAMGIFICTGTLSAHIHTTGGLVLAGISGAGLLIIGAKAVFLYRRLRSR